MTAPTHYNGKPIPLGTWLAHAAETAAESSGLSPHDTVPVATYNRMVRKRDEAVALAGTYLQAIHAAPHAYGGGGYWCLAGLDQGESCSCWKAGL
jgi:hypothetical protein